MKLTNKAGYKFPNKKIAVILGIWTAIQQLTEGMTQRAETLGWKTGFVMDAPEGITEAWDYIKSSLSGRLAFKKDVTLFAKE
jgi:hypothetical protein